MHAKIYVQSTHQRQSGVKPVKFLYITKTRHRGKTLPDQEAICCFITKWKRKHPKTRIPGKTFILLGSED